MTGYRIAAPTKPTVREAVRRARELIASIAKPTPTEIRYVCRQAAAGGFVVVRCSAE